MQQEYVDFRSIDRVSGTQANDFTLALQNNLPKNNTTQVSFSGLEMPSTRYTIEEKENALVLGEGAAIGDHTMSQVFKFKSNRLGENEILLSTVGGEDTVLTVPATLMPVGAFTPYETRYNDDGSFVSVSSSIYTPQRHGFKDFLEWAKDRDNLDILLVGGEPHPRAKHYFNAGIRLSDLPLLTLDDPKSVLFQTYMVNSVRVGDGAGYLHCPMLHFE